MQLENKRSVYTGAHKNRTWEEWLSMRVRAGSDVEMITGLLHWGLPELNLHKAYRQVVGEETGEEVSTRLLEYARRLKYYLKLSYIRGKEGDELEIAQKARRILILNFFKPVTQFAEIASRYLFACFLLHDSELLEAVVRWFGLNPENPLLQFNLKFPSKEGPLAFYSSSKVEKLNQEATVEESFFNILFWLLVMKEPAQKNENFCSLYQIVPFCQSGELLRAASEKYRTRILETQILLFPYNTLRWPIHENGEDVAHLSAFLKNCLKYDSPTNWVKTKPGAKVYPLSLNPVEVLLILEARAGKVSG